MKSLSDRVDEIGKTQQALASNQKKLMEKISTMKTEMSSTFSAMLAILSNLQGNRSSRSEDQQMSLEKETEVFDDICVDAMEVYYHTLDCV